LRDNHDILLEQYRDNYKKVLLSEEKYFELFSEKMHLGIDKT